MRISPKTHALRLGRFAGMYLYGLVVAAYGFTMGVVTRRGRGVVETSARLGGYRRGPATTLPRISAAQIADETTPVRLLATDGTFGNISLLELVVLARLARARAPSAIFEIGTFDGRTTLNLAANAPEQCTVYTLDLPSNQPAVHELAAAELRLIDKPESGTRFKGTPFASRIKQLYGDSATFDFAPYSAEMVFVDGSHSYEYVQNDSMKALGLLGPKRGIILWHDYGEWEGVTRALNELHERDPRFARLQWIDGTTLVALEHQDP